MPQRTSAGLHQRTLDRWLRRSSSPHVSTELGTTSTTSIESNGLMQLTDLPTELLQKILKEVFCGVRLGCKYRPSTHTVLIRYPSHLLVSTTYFAEAKIALLEQATISLPYAYFPVLQLPIPPDFSPDFEIVQRFQVFNIWKETFALDWSGDQIVLNTHERDAPPAIEVAPLKNSLTLEIKPPTWSNHVPDTWRLLRESGEAMTELAAHKHLYPVEIENALRNCFNSWAGSLELLLQRDKSSKLCVELDLKGQFAGSIKTRARWASPWAVFTRNLDCVLDLSVCVASQTNRSVRTKFYYTDNHPQHARQSFALMSDKDEAYTLKDEPAFNSPMTPSSFDKLVDKHVR
ncbi:uncharacterized protein AB675_8443 [Cyphellophora attinorum]|uniref:Uncharacterized protein n=1 Tax=Cyphellophora attinorum TaxID=1664694 RepID=A0A0N1HA92_9EURO|nr:uncharacterized protein AB675_8443 [Phialophora attinorum]KPI44726.1 hypothetical protein AB675_8443 [Phialophora attinorum]